MADHDGGGQQLAAPERRGSLHVADKVVIAIARAAALGVAGVAPASATSGVISGLVSSAVGRDLPRASAKVAGSRAQVEIAIASVWPEPAARVAADVREAVTSQLAHLAAVQADAVSVTIDAVVKVAAPSRSRVR